MRFFWIAAAAAASATPAFAQDPLAPLPVTNPAQPPAVVRPAPPPVIAAPVFVPRDWQGVFAGIRNGNWPGARLAIATLPRSPLTAVARAELFTARNSPVVSLLEIQALLAEAPDLPQAEQLARMATARGALAAPLIVARRPVVSLGAAPGRSRARPVSGEPLADELRKQLEPYVDANDAAGAEYLVMTQAPMLSFEARAEAWQRVAWLYYVTSQDAHARRVADSGRLGATGEWSAAAAWVSGLASWRLNDCNAATRSFRYVSAVTRQRELRTGAYYWAARAEQACRRPQAVAALLGAASQSPESFYGLLARETLGAETRISPARPVSTAGIDAVPNIRRAVELARIGERSLADQMLRHQARIGAPGDQQGLVAVAKRLDLAGSQYWLATNGQRGARVAAADRYPTPNWTPVRGWRVEPALAFAHAIQESSFQSSAVSPIGATGLLQVRPGTASDMARAAGLPYSPASLFDPRYNLEFGQSFIERLRASSATRNQLPKVIASYNAGPVPVARWASIQDRGDPVLWIESIPYWETRYYVPAVMRNLWVYEGLGGRPAASLSALAQHRWPPFPTAR
ncbi:MAG: lytic transglycosylase domain-containing protein [Pseudomonadota bacterium]|nr:lytic transglycosylase domain-containing protein [Pseudomonadota bacterium]